MAKITLSPITGSYASVVALNARFQQIEDALNDDVLWRDGFSGEPNSMAVDLDMANNDLLNINDILIGGVGLIDSVNAAAVSAAAALVSETNAASSYDSFDDRYLGAKASDPTLDNDGNALLTGAIYFHTTSNVMRTYNGSSWGDIGTAQNSASSVNIADAGGYYTGTDVEVSLQEVGADIITHTTDIAINTAKIAGLNTKVIDIGDWNMNSTNSVNIAHGLTLSKIRNIKVSIYTDVASGGSLYDFATDSVTTTDTNFVNAGATNIQIQRALGGFFDGVAFDDTSYNRGWITIQYTD